MATVQLKDVYHPDVWARLAQEKQTQLNAFLASGIAVEQPLITSKLSGGSDQIEMPFFAALGNDEPNSSNDNPNDRAVPKKIGFKKQIARSASRNQAWSAMSISRELTDADPVGAITSKIGGYWANDEERRIIASCNGILASNIKNNGGDMVVDLSKDSMDNISDKERVSETAFLDAEQTMGDHMAALTAVAMHSVIYTRLRKQKAIQDHFDPETGSLLFRSYLGKRVIVDDSMPITEGTNRRKYTIILFGSGAIATGNGPVRTPSELTRDSLSGNGGGQDIIISRVNSCYHPNGFSFTSHRVNGIFPSRQELAIAENWQRVVNRKHIPMAFIQVND